MAILRGLGPFQPCVFYSTFTWVCDAIKGVVCQLTRLPVFFCSLTFFLFCPYQLARVLALTLSEWVYLFYCVANVKVGRSTFIDFAGCHCQQR